MRCLEWFDLGIQMFWHKLLVVLPTLPNVNLAELLKVSNDFLSAKCMIHHASFSKRWTSAVAAHTHFAKPRLIVTFVTNVELDEDCACK